MRVRVLFLYTRVVKQSNSVSLENPTTEGGLSLADLSAKIPSAVGFMACRKTIDNKIKRAHVRGYAKKREVT